MAGGIDSRLEILRVGQFRNRAAVGAEGDGDGGALQAAAVRPDVEVVLRVRVQAVHRVGGVIDRLHGTIAGHEAGRTVLDVPGAGVADFSPVDRHVLRGDIVHREIDRVSTRGDIVEGHVIETEVVAAVAVAGTEGKVAAIAGVVLQRVLHQRPVASRNRVEDLERSRVALVGHHTEFKDDRGRGRGFPHPEGELQLVQVDALIDFRHNGDIEGAGTVVDTDHIGLAVRCGGIVDVGGLGRVGCVTIPAVEIGIDARAVGLAVEVLDVRKFRDGVALGAEGDRRGPLAHVAAAADGPHTHLVLRVGIQAGDRVGGAADGAGGGPVGIGSGLVLDLAVLGSVRVEPRELGRGIIHETQHQCVRRDAAHHVASGQADVIDLRVQTAGRRHIVDAPVGVRGVVVLALRTVHAVVDGVELGVAVVDRAAGDVVDDQQQVVITVVIEVRVEGDVNPAVGAGVVERDGAGIDMHVVVQRGGPDILHELVVGSVCHVYI